MTLVEIEKTEIILPPIMCCQSGIWQFVIYEMGNYFSWFGEGRLPKTIVNVGSVIINNENFIKVNAIEELYEKTFCQIKNMMYVMTADKNPLWMYYKPRFGVITGFTSELPGVYNGIYYGLGLDYIPEISEKADNLEYGAMNFKNDTIKLINTKGEYDKVIDYFGNNVRVKTYNNGILKNLYEYYIKNVKIQSDKTTFVCGDKREKLSQKVPNKRFTLKEFPKIKEDFIDEIMQDVYGKCEWVNCVPVDELDVFDAPIDIIINDDNYKDYLKTTRTFYAARKITSLDTGNTDGNNKVWIKQTQGEIEGEENTEIDESGKVSIKERWTECPINTGKSDFEKGLIAIDIQYCMPAVWSGYDVPELFEVRASGVFWTPSKADLNNRIANRTTTFPIDVIVELLFHYCGIKYNDYNFKKTEFENEIGSLKEIGIVYDDEQNIFEAIEKLQNSSNYGFQFKTDFDKFTARRDDNKRAVSDVIKINDIVDIGKVEIDMNISNYATIVDVPYKMNYYKEKEYHCEGTKNRDYFMLLYGIEKKYIAESYLTNESDAMLRRDNLEQFFEKTRPVISNLEVINHPDIQIYDIIIIDLRIPMEQKKELRQLTSLFSDHPAEYAVFGQWQQERIVADFTGTDQNREYRTFGGELKCKVMGTKLDINTGENTIDLVEVG